MKVKAAFIFIADEVDYTKHNAEIDTPVLHLYVVGVKNYNEAEAVAKELVDYGVTQIELCAGFGSEGVSRICKAVDGKAVIGCVKFDLHPSFGFKSGDNLFQ